jgi:probable HAF family extracellular repeat protein
MATVHSVKEVSGVRTLGVGSRFDVRIPQRVESVDHSFYGLEETVMTMQRRRSHMLFEAIAIGFVSLCLTAASARGQYCTVQDLGSLSTTFQQSAASGINNSGEVAGWTGIGGNRHAILFEDELIKDLGTLANDDVSASMASGINNWGQVVGTSGLGAGKKKNHAFLFDNDRMIDLGALGSDPANHDS